MRRHPVPDGLTIREFEPTGEQYDAFTRIFNEIYTDHPTTAEQRRYGDDHMPSHCLRKRWLAWLDGEAVGYGHYYQFARLYHPRKFAIFVSVAPGFRRRGIGSALFDVVMAGVEEHDPLTTRAVYVQETWQEGIGFLERRGFEEENREFESRLDMALFDFSPYEGVDAEMDRQGIDIVTYADLQGTENLLDRLWRFDDELECDTPGPEAWTSRSKEAFLDAEMRSPLFIDDAYFVAVDRATGEFVGVSNYLTGEADDDLHTGLTGVKSTYRRRGIATALKLRGLRYAVEHGYATVRTDNNTTNRPMLNINERLGFEKEPAWLWFIRRRSA